MASKLWLDTFGPSLLDTRQSNKSDDSDAPDEIEFSAEGQDAVDLLLKAVNFAATMAFTNWGGSFCGISVRYLDTAWKESWLSEDSRPLAYRDPKSVVWHDPTLEMLLDHAPTSFSTTDLLRYAIHISIDTANGTEVERFLDPANNLIAIACEGLVVARTMSMPDDGAIQKAQLLSIYPGGIVCEDECLNAIRPENSASETSAELVTRPSKISPSNAVQDLKLVSQTVGERNEVSVATQIMLGTECCQVADAVAISEMIPQLLVSNSCSHDYYSPYQVPKRTKTTNEKDEDVYRAAPLWQCGLSFQSKHRPASIRARPAGMKVYVQSVDRNPEGQWLASQWTSDWDPFALILQEGSCLECVYKNLRHIPLVEVCIINGGTEASSSHASKRHSRASSQPQDCSAAANPDSSSTTEKDPHAGRRESQEDRRRKPANPSSFEAMGVPMNPDASKTGWPRFGWPRRKDTC